MMGFGSDVDEVRVVNNRIFDIENGIAEEGRSFSVPDSLEEVTQLPSGVSMVWKGASSIPGANGASPALRFQAECHGTGIFRIRFAAASETLRGDTPMLVPLPRAEGFRLTESDGSISLDLAGASCEIEKNPFRLRMLDSKKRKVVELLSKDDYNWFSYEVVNQDRRRHNLTLSGGALAVTTITTRIDSDEGIYGLGQRFLRFNLHGQTVNLAQYEGQGNTALVSYLNVPFYVSTAGYGIFVNSSSPMRFELGSHYDNCATVFVADSQIDFFVFVGPALTDILRQYADVTGHAPSLPRWSYGLWASRAYYETRQVTEDVARRFRKEGIPCDVISVDCNWFEGGPWMCDLKFSEKTFPRPREMFKAMADIGFKVCVWQLPAVHIGLKNYKEGKEKGYLVRRSTGDVYHLDFGGRWVYALIDFTNKDAVDWYSRQIKDVLKLGAKAIKTDMPEYAPVDGVYAQGRGIDVHNIYPFLYNEAIYKCVEEVQGKGQGIVWARSSWAGGQRFPLVWSGDPIARFDDLQGALRGGLATGMSGHPFWSHDIGGFFGQPTDDLYVRWAQVGFFSSHTRLHGEKPKEPWFYSRESQEIFKRYALMRYRLLPYIFSAEASCVESGLPFIRPLVLYHQDDKNVRDIGDQYYFGENLMVAPILTQEKKRLVYLPPETEWYDFWNGSPVGQSGWLEVEAGLDKLPIYVPAGGIVVMGPEMNYVDEKAYEPLEVRVYGRTPRSFKYSNGKDLYLLEGVIDNGTYTFKDGGLSRSHTCNVHIFG